MSKKDIGNRKLAAANKLEKQVIREQAAQQKEAYEHSAAGTAGLKIVGSLRGPVARQSAFQRDLQDSKKDYIVPNKPRAVKPAVCKGN